jgi:hypothetical protein
LDWEWRDHTRVGGWEETHIPLEKDETFTIEISGSVSPDLFQALPLKEYMRKMEEWKKAKKAGKAGEEPKHPGDAKWPSTGPEGYPPEWYPKEKGSVSKVEMTIPMALIYKVLFPSISAFETPPEKHHANHKEWIEKHFTTDETLTIKGKTHNSVIGIVLPVNDKPKRAKSGEPPAAGYDWEKEKDKLLYLSAKTYPCSLTANEKGFLWVTINDADDFRWDNVGFFFLKLTRRPAPFKGHRSVGSTTFCQNPHARKNTGLASGAGS